MAAGITTPTQGSFEELGTPLIDVTFCVIDLETTGGSPLNDRITEIGAVKVRAGECLGTLQTMVNPGCAIPPSITVLTGISEHMVSRAPRIEEVLGNLTDFIGDAVIVGHNVRFDVGFLNAALERDGRDALSDVRIDTVTLARRLLRDEVPNCKLGTLARQLRLAHQPSHRALDDAWATADLLHVLLERAQTMGVTGLDDLRQLPTMAAGPHADKLRLTERLPRTPGVYLFRDRAGRVLYVGKATNLRARVRSYFASDDRRKIGQLLRETEQIDHKRCADPFEARVLEIRLIHHLRPRFNREANRFDSQVFVKLSLGERLPRLTVVRQARDDGALYLGPLPSRRSATLAIEAIHTVMPLRRCTARPGRGSRSGPCIPAQLGVAMCACTESFDPALYVEIVARAEHALRRQPELLIEPLHAKMNGLALEERFEDAAAVRDRLAALTDLLRRQRRFDRWRDLERLVVRQRNGIAIELRRGRLTRIWVPPEPHEMAGRLPGTAITAREVEALPPDPGPPGSGPLPMELTDELSCVDSWLNRHAATLRVERIEGTLASPVSELPHFHPAPTQLRDGSRPR